jgi:GNAT superfamily N-acetyltransferase
LPLADPIIRALRDDDGLAALSLGNAELRPLKSFLRRHARAYQRASVARTYVIVNGHDKDRGGRVWAYISLVASEASVSDAHAPPGIRWPDGYAIPAVKIARMAVDQTLQGRGFGRMLVTSAIALVQDHVATRVGCRLLITDAKHSAVRFYERAGFTMLETESNRSSSHPVMFLLLNRGG